jgi:dihydropteroate synthase
MELRKAQAEAKAIPVIWPPSLSLKVNLRKFANLSLERPLVMGIVNVTPDSFTDGGEFFGKEHAIEHGKKLLQDGADILDLGGESTRPGAQPVALDEELRRVLPVITELAKLGAIISVDTRHSYVMEKAIEAGATVLNDVTALEGEGSLEVAANSSAYVILMHMRGSPLTMMNDTIYDNLVSEVSDYLGHRISACLSAGIGLDRIAIDPGFGFGKTREQNLELIENLGLLDRHQCPIMVGLSRKFGKHKPAKNRLPESLAVAVKSVINGADIIRVHEVAETRDALSAIQY